MQLLQKIVRDYNIELPTQIQNTIDIPCDNEAEQSKVSVIISNLISKHTHNTNINQLGSIENELASFGSVMETDALQFWKHNTNKYANLSTIANVVLAIPISNAKAEGAFSISGCLIREKRASIDPLRAEKVLFIHDNYNLLQF